MRQPPFTVHIRHELVEIVIWLLSPPKASRRVHLGSLESSRRSSRPTAIPSCPFSAFSRCTSTKLAIANPSPLPGIVRVSLASRSSPRSSCRTSKASHAHAVVTGLLMNVTLSPCPFASLQRALPPLASVCGHSELALRSLSFCLLLLFYPTKGHCYSVIF